MCRLSILVNKNNISPIAAGAPAVFRFHCSPAPSSPPLISLCCITEGAAVYSRRKNTSLPVLLWTRISPSSLKCIKMATTAMFSPTPPILSQVNAYFKPGHDTMIRLWSAFLGEVKHRTLLQIFCQSTWALGSVSQFKDVAAPITSMSFVFNAALYRRSPAAFIAFLR